MTPDDATLMAYADGELDPLAARRVERALAADPALAARVEEQRRLRARLAGAFGAVAAEPVPATLTARLSGTVVPLRPRAARSRGWVQAGAIAASLVLGVVAGRQWPAGPLQVAGDRLVARGALAGALEHELSGGSGATRLVASFQATDGRCCRVFGTAAMDGIACHARDGWAVVRTQAAVGAATIAYRQAAGTAPALLAAAQDMMADAPLAPGAERQLRDRGWKKE